MAASQESNSFWSCLCPCLKPKQPVQAEQNDSKTQSNSNSSGGDVTGLVTQVSQNKQQRPQGVELDVTQHPSAPRGNFLLPPWPEGKARQKCLVLDLDETLVHSSFTEIPNADFVISLDLNNKIHHVYVRKRPGVDEFLKWCGPRFEVVIFTASLSKYADPLLDELDKHNAIQFRLFREHCVYLEGNYVKDLSHLGRPLKDCIIVDNSPYSYALQVPNSIPVLSWFTEDDDIELFQLVEFLERFLTVDDVRSILVFERLQWTGQPIDEHN